MSPNTTSSPKQNEDAPRRNQPPARPPSPDTKAPQTPQPPPPPPSPPSWAKMVINERVQAAYSYNTRLVAEANKKGARYDVVMYGDSITAALAADNASEWREFANGWRAAALGIGGTSVEELAWRLMRGGEKFDKDPRVVILLIGIINLKHTHTAPDERLDVVLKWMRAVWPTSRILLLNILPNKLVDVNPTNAKYERLAAAHGITFSRCGSDLNPNDTSHIKDGTHPASGGYRMLLRCLRPVVANLLA